MISPDDMEARDKLARPDPARIAPTRSRMSLAFSRRLSSGRSAEASSLTALSVGIRGVLTQEPVDQAVSPPAVPEVGAPQQALAAEAALLQRPLLGQVVDLRSGPDAVGGRRRQQVLYKQALGGRAHPLPPELGRDEGADLPDPRTRTPVLAPDDPPDGGAVLQGDSQEAGTPVEEPVLLPPSPEALGPPEAEPRERLRE